MKILKIRDECHTCRYLIGDRPETAKCFIKCDPTCYRQKKTCEHKRPFIKRKQNDVNEKCQASIERFYQIKEPSFTDFAELKTYGLDVYSAMTYKEAQEYCKKYHIQLNLPEIEYLKAVRWIRRGLTVSDAIRKVKVDKYLKEKTN